MKRRFNTPMNSWCPFPRRSWRCIPGTLRSGVWVKLVHTRSSWVLMSSDVILPHGEHVAHTCWFSLYIWQFLGVQLEVVTTLVDGTELWASTKPKPVPLQTPPFLLIKPTYVIYKISVPLTYLKVQVSFFTLWPFSALIHYGPQNSFNSDLNSFHICLPKQFLYPSWPHSYPYVRSLFVEFTVLFLVLS